MTRIVVETDLLGSLQDAALGPAPRLLLLPDGVAVAELPDLLVREAISYHETELAYLEERIAGLQVRRDALREAAEIEHEPRTLQEVIVGPRPYLAALDALDTARRLERALTIRLEELRDRDRARAEAEQVVAGFTVVPRSAPGTSEQTFMTVVEVHDSGYTRDTDARSRLARRREHATPFIEAEQRANAKVLVPRPRLDWVGPELEPATPTSLPVTPVTHTAPDGSVREVVAT